MHNIGGLNVVRVYVLEEMPELSLSFVERRTSVTNHDIRSNHRGDCTLWAVATFDVER